MSRYCTNCGNPVAEGAKFCEHCGSPVNAAGSVGAPETGDPFPPAAPAPVVGYSSRVSDPEILAAMKKNKKATGIFAALLIPLPLIGVTVYSLVSDKMEPKQGILYGGIVSLIFLLCVVINAIRKKTEKPYEAVVTDKKTRRRTDRDHDNINSYTEYITFAQTTDGKKKKIVEREGGMIYAYDYLNIGDRFKFHPQFNLPCYELYDKTNAPYILCVSCGTKNPVQADRCGKCSIPLLK